MTNVISPYVHRVLKLHIHSHFALLLTTSKKNARKTRTKNSIFTFHFCDRVSNAPMRIHNCTGHAQCVCKLKTRRTKNAKMSLESNLYSQMYATRTSTLRFQFMADAMHCQRRYSHIHTGTHHSR